MFRLVCVVNCAALFVCQMVLAGQPSLLNAEGLQRQPLVDTETAAIPLFDAGSGARVQQASLFVGTASGGLFEPSARPIHRSGSVFGVAGLRSLIAEAEAGSAGYDAVQYGARIKPPAPPTQLTIGDIRRWIKATPGQPHAIGRYQFIPPTFERLVHILGLTDQDRFSPRIQDQLADILLEDAGLSAYVSGAMRQTVFMDNLAKIWAGLPNSTGRSHYHGYAGNKATISWDYFQSEMDRIFPRG